MLLRSLGQFIRLSLVITLHPDTLPASQTLTSNVLSHSLPSDVTLAVFAVGVQNPEGWDFLYRKYQSSLSTSEKNKIEFALSISQDKNKLQW